MPETPKVQFRAKVCLVGDHAVGKTSLIRRFVTGRFSDVYINTLGAAASKKSMLTVSSGGTPARLDITFLDIMGDRALMDVLREAYFHGAAGVLAVADITRPETVLHLHEWVQGVRSVAGDVPVLLVANKADLVATSEALLADLEERLRGHGDRVIVTSAKSGAGVEDAFAWMAKNVVDELIRRS